MHFITRRGRDPTKIEISIVKIGTFILRYWGSVLRKLLSQQFLGNFELQCLKNCKSDFGGQYVKADVWFG